MGTTPGAAMGGNGATGGHAAAGGLFWTGGASYVVPTAGYGAMMSTGGSSYYYVTGGKSSTGGTTYQYTGGTRSYTGGTTYQYTGGTKSYTGGTTYQNTGGKSFTGGTKATGGSTYYYTGTGGSSFTGAMKIAPDGYVSMAAGMYTLHGYTVLFQAGSNTSANLSFGTNNICATGVVAPNPSYISYAGIGVDINQSSASSSVSTTGSLTIDAKYITIAFSNDYSSQLRFQLNDAAGDNWCYDITGFSSPVTIPLYSFNTHCWDNSGDPFKTGTAITSISMVVPGDAVLERKFSFCLYGVSFQ